MTIAEAYTFCRTIAKREAKNFYYSFRVLPQHKSDAMCAVYAFMRRADDISDDESMPIAQRRLVMAQWLAAWREARRTGITDDPTFLALNDTQKRFAIPDQLLEDLVCGTTMDLEESLPGTVTVIATKDSATKTGDTKNGQPLQIYENFDGLYRYCYLVASVVGLVCIRIFGYKDPQAELLAEKTGIAFQLTNILRDVSEDAERGRIYLPLQDLQASQLDVAQLLQTVRKELPSSAVKKILQLEASRASEYYTAAQQLLPLIDQDSRAALWVLVTIYRGLLEKIIAKDYDVFTERVSVPTPKKLMILALGAGKAARNRIVS